MAARCSERVWTSCSTNGKRGVAGTACFLFAPASVSHACLAKAHIDASLNAWMVHSTRTRNVCLSVGEPASR
jgi:hypothetical protein